MQKGLKLDGQMRALAISFGGGALMAVVAMLIPVSVFETITGATGISEIVPATAAPLGDTARAIIAFLFAAGGFALLAAILMRQPGKVRATPAATPAGDSVSAAGKSFAKIVQQKVSDFVADRRTGPVVTELSDLPKLRAVDAHPDAPPRRPISAHSEFGEVDPGAALPLGKAVEENPVIVETPAVIMEQTVVAVPQEDELAIDNAPLVAEVVQVPESAPETIAVPDSDTATQAGSFDSVSAMVDRLETALMQRQDQLARLEALAVRQLASDDTIERPAEAQSVAASGPPPLEVVASHSETVPAEDDMDEALRSALATLQRMNVRAR